MRSRNQNKSKVRAGDQDFLPSYLSQPQFIVPQKEDYNTYVREQTFNPYRGYDTTTKILTVDKTTDNVYVNVTISHPIIRGVTGATGINFPQAYSVDETPIDAVYNVTKDDPILDRCSDYYCSVVRFEIPLLELPLSICPIIPGVGGNYPPNGCTGGNPDLTPMIIGIDYGTSGPVSRFPTSVEYLSQNLLHPPCQNATVQIVTPYYYIYSYQNYLDMFNNALATSWFNSGLATLFPNYIPPYFFFTASTNLITLVVPKCFVVLTSPATSIPLIFMNAFLGNFLQAFNLSFKSYNNPQGNDEYFLLSGSTNNTPDHFYYPGGVLVPTPTDPGTTG